MAEKAKEQEYFFARIGKEVDRLKSQHEWFMSRFDGKLVWAPIDMKDPNLKVLDVGTANGIFLRDLQNQVSPTAELVGTDSTEAFLPTERTSGNITYGIQDITHPPPADYINRFDLVNERLVMMSASHVGLPKVFENLISTIKPGGWLQGFQVDVTASERFTPAVKDFFLLTEAVFKMNGGLNTKWVPQLGEKFKEAGLENVKQEVFDLEMGNTAKSEQQKRLGMKVIEASAPSLLEAIKRGNADVPASVTDNLSERLHKELDEQGSIIEIIIVYGQKKKN